MNSFTKLSEISDGTASTLVVGESSHTSKWGAGDGYGKACEGGPATWWFGGATIVGDPNGLSVGRVLRGTKHPVNSSILCMNDDEDNDAPFASEHPGGAQFVFGDGHVQLITEGIDWRVYQAISTRAGEEIVSLE